jgi:cob(I)alamin adenosyltransferase
MRDYKKTSGRVLVFTGPGKGKTTAALGLVLRARGHGLGCLVLQFVKSDAAVGEVQALRDLLHADVEVCGLGFVPPRDCPQFVDHCQAAREALARAREACVQGTHDIVVLDEVCVALGKELVTEEELLSLIADRKPELTLVLTGRGATPALCDAADTVTEMVCVKHALQQGIEAQQGVEY